METAFALVFFVGAAPAWTLLIAAPNWRFTQRIAATPWVAAPPLVFWFIFAIPRFGELLPAVLKPTLPGWQALVADPGALTFMWAQIIAWDLFIGRWMYLDGRERGISPWVMGPLLVLAIGLSPIAFPLYLLLRKPLTRTPQEVAVPAPRAAAVSA